MGDSRARRRLIAAFVRATRVSKKAVGGDAAGIGSIRPSVYKRAPRAVYPRYMVRRFVGATGRLPAAFAKFLIDFSILHVLTLTILRGVDRSVRVVRRARRRCNP